MPRERKVRRRGRGEGSITRRKDGLYQASVSLGRRPDGSRHREFVYARSKAEVIEKLQELRKGSSVAAPAHQPPRLVEEFLLQWLDQQSQVCQATRQRYRQHLAHLIRHLGQEFVAALTSERVARLYTQMAQTGCSAQEIGDCSRLLGTACKSAVRQHLLIQNPVPDVPRPKVVRREVRPFTLEQVALFLAAARDLPLFALYVLAIDSGMREGEMLALEWEDFDWQRGTVRVERTFTRDGHRILISPGKTKRSRRVICLSRTTLEVLDQHRQTQLRQGLIHAHVFCNRRGGYIWPEHLRERLFKPLLRRAGLPVIHFHDLRHTCATLLLLMGEKTLVVSERLGHSKPSITADVYQHLLEGMQEGAAQRMQQIMDAALPATRERLTE